MLKNGIVVTTLAFVLTACGHNDNAQDIKEEWKWATVSVVPADPVPPECDNRLAVKRPRLTQGAKSDEEAARAYDRLNAAFKARNAQANVCGAWATGQR